MSKSEQIKGVECPLLFLSMLKENSTSVMYRDEKYNNRLFRVCYVVNIAVDDAVLIDFHLIIFCFSCCSFRGDARCTIQCSAALGKVPQLQCKHCLCLYHHECAKFSANLDASMFVCEVGSRMLKQFAPKKK